ncbi:hypothetical protein [Paludisphaera mucosa]|uniref:Uncharacterized protein n=1 Tax=Paludisphaera mucosa TaxID=3030827 RepID=A0ABT6FKJ0_9BACT|nr:hypothetical protein [Paludisphaera mucosa]MDG3008072.1 hypothetical protein [Paludisphaera mucosa]
MRSALRPPGRFAPALLPLERRLLLSQVHGMDIGPPPAARDAEIGRAPFGRRGGGMQPAGFGAGFHFGFGFDGPGSFQGAPGDGGHNSRPAPPPATSSPDASAGGSLATPNRSQDSAFATLGPAASGPSQAGPAPSDAGGPAGTSTPAPVATASLPIAAMVVPNPTPPNVVMPGGGWTGLVASIGMVGPQGPAKPLQAAATDREGLRPLVGTSAAADVSNLNAAESIAVASGTTKIPPGEAAPAGPAADEPATAPLGSGIFTRFLPLDGAAVDLVVARILGRIEDLGAPIAVESSRLPMIVPIAAGLAAFEAARRWRGRTSQPGPTIARGSRFSSLRGLS